MTTTVKVSWSQLRNHEECHQRTYLTRQGKRNKRADQRGFFPGTVTDRVVRDWLLNEPLKNIGGMPAMVEDIVNRELKVIDEEGGVMKWKHSSDRDDVIRECIEAVTKIEPWLLKYVVPFEYTPDFGFKSPVKFRKDDGTEVQVLLIGFMDILVKHPVHGYFVFDVKHTKNNDYWRKTEAQLTFYDLAVQLLFGENTKKVALLQPLCDEQVKSFTINDDKRAQLLQRIERMAWDIVNEEQTPTKKTSNCFYCDVKHACVKFRGVMKNGKRVMEFPK